jgi:hypothetical protein
MCVTGLSVRHVGETPGEISASKWDYIKYFLIFFIHSNTQIEFLYEMCLSASDSWSSTWFHSEKPKILAFFQQCNWYINCCPSAAECQAAHNRKGGLSQNCLACVSFSMRFQYFLSGWEGSTADRAMYGYSWLMDLQIPEKSTI